MAYKYGRYILGVAPLCRSRGLSIMRSYRLIMTTKRTHQIKKALMMMPENDYWQSEWDV